ncbi:thiol:disulfide interchange protein DsbA/DsbL [Candidatus Kinetoplastidibacterium blastocrithidiae]|uniref:thiol:disulfide interchange protein DsbA/DsbL n=1 Tax=Candidatus Kinetoplastidibacterium blastocrithidiae TaxID=233181 RepID=UPI001CEF770C|nr:thiol:disulfide interchange protein DsbA/DsbL [Candidatus Kinetoplastibacterium blastocrithidii]
MRIIIIVITFLISNNCNAENGYEVITNKIESLGKNKIEVIEFLSYMCHHCTAIENILNQWQSSLTSDVTLIKIPVSCNKKSEELQKLYLTINELNKPHLHSELFYMFGNKKKSIKQVKDLTWWLNSKNINTNEFLELYNSFHIYSKSNRANQLARLYEIKGVPTFIIGGKYITSPAMAGDDYECTIKTIDHLIEKLRKE